MSKENTKCLEAIIEYNMPADEAKAFKLVCVYLDLAQKFITNYRHPRMPKGDPRKSELFRYCYKLVSEIEDKLVPSEYKFYIKAQFDILSNVKFADGTHPMIAPYCLVGKKAWNRWLIWKNKFDKTLKFLNTKIDDNVKAPPIHLLKKDLEKLKHLFFVQFDRYDKSDIVKSLENGSLFQWVNLGRVPVFYLLLSPIVNAWREKNKIDLMKYSIDIDPFNVYVSKELKDHFAKEFAHEY